MPDKTALITGITGQDGAYLAQLLLGKGYRVFGTHRRAEPDTWRLQELEILDRVELLQTDLTALDQIHQALEQSLPDEVYNLAAQSFVAHSFEKPLYTHDVDGFGVARLLESLRMLRPSAKFCQASSAQIFGSCGRSPQCEETLCHPKTPYAVAKLYAHWLTLNYRDFFGMFACSAILFNHESPLRGREFVTRKITAGLAELALGRGTPIKLGNLDSKRDWGFAGDYVHGLWLMLQQPEAEDYVFATGEARSVREFAEAAATACNFDLVWQNDPSGKPSGANDRKTGQQLILLDPSEFRPAEADLVVGDSAKALRQLGWERNTDFQGLVKAMVDAEFTRLTRQPNGGGHFCSAQ
jgi:GDPmannose 4,6-dehydratase